MNYPGGQACFAIKPSQAEAHGPYWLSQMVSPLPLEAGKPYEVALIAAESGQAGDIKGYVAQFTPPGP